MKRVIIGCALLWYGPVVLGQSPNPGFEAVCKDMVTHGYRDETNIHGEEMGESWSTNEKFGSTWEFNFMPPDTILIDGKPGYVLAQTPAVVIAAEAPGNNGNSAGIWTYALHLGMKKVVASQVNAFGGFDPARRGVKARSTNFDCEFKLN